MKPMWATLIKNLLLPDNISLATFCYCSSFSKKCNFFMPKIVSYNHHFPKEKSCMSSSWFLSKIRGTIWLVQRFSTWIIDQSASSSYKSWHKKTNCWESFEFSSADLFTYKPDKIEISVEHLKKQWRYSYLGPLWPGRPKKLCWFCNVLLLLLFFSGFWYELSGWACSLHAACWLNRSSLLVLILEQQNSTNQK